MSKEFKTTLRIAAWSASILAVIAAGLYFMPREYAGMGFWESLYSTLRLFVFERDNAFPRTWELIVIFFAAPAIALSAVGTLITYLFRASPGLSTLFLRNHVIVCGVGRTGKLLAASLKKRGQRVVGLDQGPAEAFDEWRRESKVPVLFGDFRSEALLRRAGAKRARSIIFASGSDLDNLDAAVALYEWLRRERSNLLLIWIHIANEKLTQTARDIILTEGAVSIRFFDTYHLAASRMVSRHFNRDQRAGVHEVNILGFGKFGRDLFEVLVRDLGPDEKIHFNVVDIHERHKFVHTLAQELGVDDRIKFTRADIYEMDLEDERDKAFFLCTDDDLGNLTAAMMLACKADCNHIYVRMAHWPMSAVADHLGEDRGVTFVNINQMMTNGIETLPGIFTPPAENDLKRVKN